MERRRKTTLLPALALWLALWGSPGASKGEVCRDWNYGLEVREEPFRCLARVDDKQPTFCCGTCSLPYCCSSEEARLDPAACLLGGQRKAVTEPLITQTPAAPRGSERVAAILFMVVVMICTTYLCLFCCGCRPRARGSFLAARLQTPPPSSSSPPEAAGVAFLELQPAMGAPSAQGGRAGGERRC